MIKVLFDKVGLLRMQVLKTQTVKDSLVVTVGMGLSTLLSAASILIIARWLGPTQFGLYATTLALAVIVIDSLDLAIGGSIIRFAAESSSRTLAFIKYGFNLKLRFSVLITALFIVISQPLAAWLHPQIRSPLMVAALFIPVVFLVRFPRSLLQSQKRFIADMGLEILTSLARLGLVAVFYFFFRLTVVTSLWAYLFGALAAFAAGARLISWRFLKAEVAPAIRKEFFSYQKWLTFGFILAAVHSRIDTTLILKLAGPASTGIYQAGYRFFMPVMQLASVFSLVFAPRFASFPDLTTARTYLTKALKLSLVFGLLVLLLIPSAKLLVQLIFGWRYLEAVRPMQILTLGFAVFIVAAPLVSYLLYAVKKTQVFFGLNLLQLILLVCLDLVLIPTKGAIGAAWATSITLVTVNSLLAVLILWRSPS